MKQPFVKGGPQSLFWDNDITPEGLAFAVQQRHLVRQRLQLLAQRSLGRRDYGDVGRDDARCADRRALPIGGSTLTLAAHYYDLSAAQGRVPRADLRRQCERQHDHRRGRRTSALALRLRSGQRAGAVQHDARQSAVAAVGRSGAEPGSRRPGHARGRPASCSGAASNYAHLGSGRDVPDRWRRMRCSPS